MFIEKNKYIRVAMKHWERKATPTAFLSKIHSMILITSHKFRMKDNLQITCFLLKKNVRVMTDKDGRLIPD